MNSDNVVSFAAPQKPLLNSFSDLKSRVRWCIIAEGAPHRMTMPMLNALRDEQKTLSADLNKGAEIDYQIFTSSIPGVFNLGGDLGRFTFAARSGDREWLLNYGRLAVDIIYNFYTNYRKDITTINVIQGVATGGGFEAALSANVIIAEEQATFAFPETKFGLFPGMGAFTLLRQRVPVRVAEEIIYSGKVYTANKLLQLGVIDKVAETGCGDSAAANYIRSRKHQHAGIHAMRGIVQQYAGVTTAELYDVVEQWVDLVLKLPARNLGIMEKLANESYKVA